jgi:hypothetical protein
MLTLIFLLLGTLSIGALWSILGAISGGLSGVFAVFAALAIFAMLVLQNIAPGWKRAICALLLWTIAMVYQSYLQAAALINAQLGLGIWESAQSIGLEFAFAVARGQLTAFQLWSYAASLLLLLVLAWVSWTKLFSREKQK